MIIIIMLSAIGFLVGGFNGLAIGAIIACIIAWIIDSL